MVTNGMNRINGQLFSEILMRWSKRSRQSKWEVKIIEEDEEERMRRPKDEAKVMGMLINELWMEKVKAKDHLIVGYGSYQCNYQVDSTSTPPCIGLIPAQH